MKELGKRLLSMALVLVMVLSMIPASPIHVRAEDTAVRQTDTTNGPVVPDADSTYDINEGSYVAKVDGVGYESLQAAINAAGEGDTVKLLENIELDETLVIAAGKKITLDLNGKTIRQEKSQTAHYEMILVDGNLTIKDSVGGGKISYTDTNQSYHDGASNTITNRGTLTLLSGTVENLSSAAVATYGYPYAIDTSMWGPAAEVNTYIQGGKVYCASYSAMRLRGDSTTKAVNITVSGGEIVGTIEVQNSSSVAAKGKLTITGGTLSNSGTANVLFVFGNGNVTALEVEINGGNFTGNITVRDSIGSGFDKGIISGGTFSKAVPEELCAEGYQPKDNGYGTYGVVEHTCSYESEITVKPTTSTEGQKKFTCVCGDTYTEVMPKLPQAIVNKLGAVNVDGEYLIYDLINGGGLREGSGGFNMQVAMQFIAKDTAQEAANSYYSDYTTDFYIQITGITDGNADGCYLAGYYETFGGWVLIPLDGFVIENGMIYPVITSVGLDFSYEAICESVRDFTCGIYFSKEFLAKNPDVVVSLSMGLSENYDEALSANYMKVEGYVYDSEDLNAAYVASVNGVGYASLQAAIDAAGKGDTVKLLTDIELNVSVVNNGKTITLDLNGKTITGTDNNTSGNFYLINNNKGNLTITDSVGTGKITLTATNERNWSASSVVVANNLGTLTVKGGTIAHLGGTAMAYGIDNLTNGKGTVATLNVEGGVVDSTYFAIRQFANNGTNNLNISGGDISYVWMQSPNNNANVANISVTGGAVDGICLSGNKAVLTMNVAAGTTSEVYGTAPAGMIIVGTPETGFGLAKAVAQIGDEYFDSLQAAVDAAGEGDTVILLSDIELAETLVIAAGKKITLDLNGKTVYMTDASGATAALLTNLGTLTINDSIGGGKLSFNTTTPSANNAYASNTITNRGTVTINGGIIENTSNGGACYALDNYAGSTATINGGKLIAVKTAVRVFNWTNGAAAKATLNVCGGEIVSQNGYGINLNMGNAPEVALNITGGTITTNDTTYNLAVYVVNKGSAENMTINVSNGTLNGYFALNGLTSTTMAENAISVNGGKMDGIVCYGEPTYGFVTGGTFGAPVDEKFCAEGYQPKDNGDGTYGVVEHSCSYEAQYFEATFEADAYTVYTCSCGDTYTVTHENTKLIAVAIVNGTKYETLQAAIDAAGEGDTVILLSDIELAETLVVAAGKKITLDLNGKTITGVPATAEAYSVIINKGNLTITGNGSVVCDHKLAGSTGYAVNTITNSGTLIIDGAVIENKSTATSQIGYAIDNNSTSTDAIVVIKDGEVKASGSYYYDGIRLFCNNQTKENSVTVEGGSVSSIWMQNPSDGAAGQNAKDVKGSVTITGGTVNALYLEPSTAFEAAISGGYIGKVEYFNTAEGRDLTGFVTGGTFGVPVDERFCAEGYQPKDNGDGTYGVVEHSCSYEAQYFEATFEADAYTIYTCSCGDTYTVTHENTKKVALAQIGDLKFVSVAEAVTYAKNNDIKDLVITLVGETTKESALALEDAFNLIYSTAFDSVTIRQADTSKPYYIDCIYTGDRTVADGKFIFDGVNLVITSQIWFECDVELINNAVVTRTNDVKNFIYYGDVYIEPGSRFLSVIDDIFAGSITVDGGKTDGTYTAEPGFVSVYFDVRAGQILILENGAYVKFNAANEIGRLSLMGNVMVYDSKLEVFNNIVMGDNGCLSTDLTSQIIAKVLEGGGVICIDVSAFDGNTVQVIKADMSKFTGIIELENNIGGATCEITADGLIIKRAVAQIGDTHYATLQSAVDAAVDGDTVDLLADVRLTGKLTIGKKITINGNGHSIIADETAQWYTGSGFKKSYTHLLSINASGVILRDIVLDCNAKSNGVNIYQVDGIVLDNISIINAKYGYYALTVNNSGVIAKNALTIATTVGAIDISKGDSSMIIEDGTVTDLGNKVVFFSSTGTVDLSGAVKADQTPYFAAKDNAYYYTQAQMESRTTGYSNGLTLLTDVSLNSDITIAGTLDLNGKYLTLAEGKSVKVTNKLTITGTGAVNGSFVLTKVNAILIASEGLDVTTSVAKHYVAYENGQYVVKGDAVAWNPATGEGYKTVYAAMAAVNGTEATIQMIADSGEMMIMVPAGVTLDLNGKTLTVTMISAFGNIVDSQNGDGLLKVAKGNAMLSANNTQTPVYNVDGYYFTTFDLSAGRTWDVTNGMQFWFKPAADDKTIALLADGAADNDLVFKVRISWDDTNAGTAYYDAVFEDADIQNVFTSSDWFFITLKNYSDFENVTFTVVITSQSARVDTMGTPVSA